MLKLIKKKLTNIQGILNQSFEFVFTIYLLSGILKGIYLSQDWFISFDLTLYSGAVLSLLLLNNILVSGPKSFLTNRLWYVFPLFLFYAIAIISILYSPSKSYSIYKAILFSTNILAIMSPFFHPNFKVFRFVKIIALVAIFIGVYSFIVYGFYLGYDTNILGFDPEFYKGFYLDAGYLLGLASILVLKLENSRLKAFLINALIILLWATAARGPIIFTFISFLVYFSVTTIDYGYKGFLNRIIQKRVFLTGILLANIVLLSIVYNSSMGATVMNRTLYRFSVIIPDNIDGITDLSPMDDKQIVKQISPPKANHVPGQSNFDRVEHYLYSWNMINKSWESQLFGYGFGSYGIIKTKTDGRLYPHNIFLEIWFETGLIGLTPFLLFLITGMMWTLKNRQQIMGIAVLYLLANTFKSYSLIDHRIIMGIMGIALFIYAERPAFGWLVLKNTAPDQKGN